jgi:hypothetical protein
MLVRAGVVEVV